MSYFEYPPYVPVAVRREKALKAMDKLRKKGEAITPISIQGLKIAKKFWGIQWCTHCESMRDYESRLTRGRTYVRNGSVCHLHIAKGHITAIVSGSSLYNISVNIDLLSATRWTAIKKQCTGNVLSLFDILQGKLSDGVMQVVADEKKGLFPQSTEIDFHCDCPDDAYMCKHIAATLYGVGARLDEDPSLLFLLRGVDPAELISENSRRIESLGEGGTAARLDVDNDSLGDLFGIEMESTDPKPKSNPKKLTTPQIQKHVQKKAQAKKKTEKKAPQNKNQAYYTKIARSLLRKADAQKKLVLRGRPPSAASILRLRNKLGLSKARFAEGVGVSASTITRWETSDTPLNLSLEHRQALQKMRAMKKQA